MTEARERVRDPQYQRLHAALLEFFRRFPFGRGDGEARNRRVWDDLSAALGVRIQLDSDRHYAVCDQLRFCWLPERGLIDMPELRDRAAQHSFIDQAGGEYWTLQLLLSDLGPYASLYANRFRRSHGRLELQVPPRTDWPDGLEMTARHLEERLVAGGWFFPPDAWLNEEIGLRADYPQLDSPSNVFTHLFGEVC